MKSMAFKERKLNPEMDEHFGHVPFDRSSSMNKNVTQQRKSDGLPTKRKADLNPEEKQKRAVFKKQLLKKKQEKKKRIIIRNLSFQVNEDELRFILSKFGPIVDVSMPKNQDGKKKGFAFAQFENFKSSIQAIKKLNFKELYGRPVAVDFAVPKSKYEHDVSSRKVSGQTATKVEIKTEVESSESESESSDAVSVKEEEEESVTEPSTSDKRVDDFLKEFDFKEESEDENEENESTSDESDNEANSDDIKKENVKFPNDTLKSAPNKIETGTTQIKQEFPNKKRAPSDDTNEGKTVFVRNLSFDSTQEGFKAAMEEFGPIKYCLLCIDRLTEHPKGTAFVKFENKEDAEKLIEKSTDFAGNGVYLDGRQLFCILAVSRENLEKNKAEKEKHGKDKRNLRLLREGLIMANSEEANHVSQSDLAKRTKLEATKKNKLKNLNFFVSDTRLCVHNIPPHLTDKQLRTVFKEATGPRAVITEVRIMKNLKKINSKFEGKSKGFGFVSFNCHEDALKALHSLNNNPTVFTPQARPIVEFSVENHLVHLSKERQRQRNKQRHQKKIDDAKGEEVNSQPSLQSPKTINKTRKKFMMHKKMKSHDEQQANNSTKQPLPVVDKFKTNKSKMHKKMKLHHEQKTENSSRQSLPVQDKPKKTKKKKRKTKNTSPNKVDRESFTKLVGQYKEKLLNTGK